MKQLYIDHDLPELLRIIYDFLEPPYTCILPSQHVPPPSAASLACICSYFSQLRRDQLKRGSRNNPHTNTPRSHPCHLVRITRRRQICRNHCKAYPILAAVAKQSKIDTLRRWRHNYKRHNDGLLPPAPHYPSAYMHFQSRGLAQFAPQLLPNIEFIEPCCGKKGWKFRWRSKLKGYNSSNDTDSDSDDSSDATETFSASLAEEINN